MLEKLTRVAETKRGTFGMIWIFFEATFHDCYQLAISIFAYQAFFTEAVILRTAMLNDEGGGIPAMMVPLTHGGGLPTVGQTHPNFRFD